MSIAHFDFRSHCFYSGQDMWTTEASFNRWLDKDVVHIPSCIANFFFQALTDHVPNLSPVSAWYANWEWCFHFQIIENQNLENISWNLKLILKIMSVSIYEVLLEKSTLICFCSFVVAFMLQQNSIVAIETVWPAMPKIFTTWPFADKFTNPCFIFSLFYSLW